MKGPSIYKNGRKILNYMSQNDREEYFTVSELKPVLGGKNPHVRMELERLRKLGLVANVSGNSSQWGMTSKASEILNGTVSREMEEDAWPEYKSSYYMFIRGRDRYT